jgi:hypothetical protein
MSLYRRVFCPVCGKVLTIAPDVPGEHLVPPHEPGKAGNLCAAVDITVTFTRAKCSVCGLEYTKHPSGVCNRCYATHGANPAPAHATDGGEGEGS